MQAAKPPLSPWMRVPMLKYHATLPWIVTDKSLQSPAPDGSVCYYFDSLSPQRIADDEPLYDDRIARAACQYLSALARSKGVEIVDGPYLQLLEDDGAVPRGFVMLRALIWADEFDELVPVEAGTSDAADHALAITEDPRAMATR